MDPHQNTGQCLGVMPRGSFVLIAMLVCVAFGAAPTVGRGAETAEALVQRILDQARPDAEREALIRDHPAMAIELVRAMTRGLGSDSEEEYRRIPWIWRVAIAVGRRNEGGEIRRLLETALPESNQPLSDWRAVVIGGGVINGISLSGGWPAKRIGDLLMDSETLRARWTRALTLASHMADDEKIGTGTRYDALRMLGMETWDRRGAQLFRYLLKGVHPELQQGAISALADVPSPSVPQALLSGFAHYSPGNRKFAVEALMRDDLRREALIDALESGRVRRTELSPAQEGTLLKQAKGESHERIKRILAP